MYSKYKRFPESFIVYGIVIQDHVKTVGYGFLVAKLQPQNFKSDYNTKVILVLSYELFAQCFSYITHILKWLQKALIIKF